jgi:phage-related protein
MQDPRIVNAYLDTLTKQFNTHKIFDKARLLQQKEPCMWDGADYQAYERLDTLITESMIYAERTVTF